MEEIHAFTGDMSAIADEINEHNRMVEGGIAEAGAYLASFAENDPTDGTLPDTERLSDDEPSSE